MILTEKGDVLTSVIWKSDFGCECSHDKSIFSALSESFHRESGVWTEKAASTQHRALEDATFRGYKFQDLLHASRKPTRCARNTWHQSFPRGRINREVQTVNWEAGKKGAVETGVKSDLKKVHKPWIRGKKGAQTVN